jgi:hypothetical protein
MCAVYRYANPHGHWSNDPGPFPDPRDTSYALQQLNRALTDREALRIAREISAMNDAGQIDLAWSLLKLTIG